MSYITVLFWWLMHFFHPRDHLTVEDLLQLLGEAGGPEEPPPPVQESTGPGPHNKPEENED